MTAVSVIREIISKEYQHGELAVRFCVPVEDVDLFWQLFPEIDLPGFIATEDGVVPIKRAGIMGELTDGAVKFRAVISAEDKAEFRRILPRPKTPAFLFRENPESSKDRMVNDAKKIYGAEAKTLRTHTNFMLNKAVWSEVGTEDHYRQWLYQRKCAACKWTPYQSMDDWIHCEAAHVRRAGEAGTAFKPPYKMIPLCPNQHNRAGCHHKQHQHGESAIGGQEQVDRWFAQHVTEWVWETLKSELGYESWAEVPPATLRAWAEPRGLLKLLPACYQA